MLKHSLFAALILTAGCATEMQTTSGQSYLAAGKFSDPKLATRAAYEPNLKLPARIGLVRLVYGRVTTLPEKERALLVKAMPQMAGEFVHLGVLEARMAGIGSSHVGQKQIRQFAASRHVDYVLILAFDPGASTAEALFMDTRTGYPYASVETALDGRGIRDFWGGRVSNQNRVNRATYRLAKKIEPDLVQMGEKLMARARAR